MNLPPFDGHATDPETLNVLAALVHLQKPDIVVEAGTYRGHGAIFMGNALDANERGVLHTADPYDHGQADALKDMDRVHYWKADYLEMLEKINRVDFAFIDASEPGPDGASVRAVHFVATLGKITPGGIILVHDTAADDWMDGEGGASVKRIRDVCQINLTSGRGLSIYHA